MQPKEAWGHATAFLERFRRVGWFDFLLLAGLVGAIFGVLSLAGEWREFRPAVHIDLAPSSLPLYVFYSLSRGLLAYACSLLFTLTYGFWAAKDPIAQRILIPLLEDRKSTRLNSSHVAISYAVFCLKKKKTAPKSTRLKPTHEYTWVTN